MSERVEAGELEVAVAAARAAGQYIRSRWGSPLSISYKGAVDLVSEVDTAAERIVVEALASRFPRDGIVAEEGSERQGQSGRRWFVDPLDGTTNFLHGHPHFSVSIGLVDDDGPLVAVVYAPVFGWTFCAERGRGATLDGRPLAVSSVKQLGQGLLATGFPYDRWTNPDNNVHRVAHLLRRCQGIRRAGSAALDLAYVAAGWLDGYWEDRLKPWDLAAGVLLVREAGGVVTGLRGEVVAFPDRAVTASNGILHQELVRVLEEAPALTVG